MGREALGCALASQARDALSNPFASELARDCKTPSLILLRKWPCFLRFAQRINSGVFCLLIRVYLSHPWLKCLPFHFEILLIDSLRSPFGLPKAVFLRFASILSRSS